MPAGVLTVDVMNRASRDEFEGALGGIFERSPWVAARAIEARPFASVEALHAAMVSVVRGSSREEQLALLRAHPDLAGRAVRAGALTNESSAEHSTVRLDRLDDGQYDRRG